MPAPRNQKKLTMKKGQVTLMLIVGILLLGVFAFAFFAISSLSKEGLELKQAKSAQLTFDLMPLQQYVSVCVNDALETGLALIASQGGYLFKDQPGGLASPDSTSFKGNKVAYVIVPSTGSEPPNYPCPQKYSAQEPSFCRYPFQSPQENIRFGQLKLPELTGGIFSFQRQLERYMAQYVKSCVDLTQLSNYRGYDVISAGELSAAVRFEPDAVIADVDYPFTLGESSTEAQFVSFRAELPVRLPSLHEAINDLLLKDISFVDFRIPEDVRETFQSRLIKAAVLNPPLTIQRIPNGPDTIILVTDPASLIKEKPFSLTLARKNRPPALEYIYDAGTATDNFEAIIPTDGHGTMSFTPSASDPDENPILYTYGLFRHDKETTNVHNSKGDEYTFEKKDLKPGEYFLQVVATDGYAQDWQNVRLKVE